MNITQAAAKVGEKVAEHSTPLQGVTVSGTIFGMSMESVLLVLSSFLFGLLTFLTNKHYKKKTYEAYVESLKKED